MSFRGVRQFAGPHRPAPRHTLQRTRRWSWMLSGWFKSVDLPPESGGTACMTLGCPDDFVAVRLGFANVSDQPWRIMRAIGRASGSYNDYVTPTGNAPWTVFTTANNGADSSEIVARDDASTTIEVRGLDSAPLARAARVCWTWTDWAPVQSLPPDPVTGKRVLMLRALLSSRQTVTCANGQLRAFTGNGALNHGLDLFIGGLKFDIDMVSEPDRDLAATTQTWTDNQLATGTMFPIVQVLTHKAGIAGMVTGDSHAQGTATTEQFSNFLFAATALLGQQQAHRMPFGMVNNAVGGLASDEFFARFELLLPAVRPSYAVVPGWTFNDSANGIRAGQAAMGAFLARLLQTVELCEAHRVMPIILTPFPRNAAVMTADQLAPWRWLRETLLRLQGGGLAVIDATAILGHRCDGEFDGTYLPSMSEDQMHPNDQGHMAIAQALAAKVAAHL